MFKKPNPKQSFPQLEEEILRYWEVHNTFQKSLDQNRGHRSYVFYDGPPFATGLPHYGHILAGTLKDVIPRYQTMKGYHVPRRWGWDCHGLPVENLVEKELSLGNKDAIEKYGIGAFNEACRSSVLRYTKEWKKSVKRMGRWVNFENSYKTMDVDYMESIWWVFKSLWDKKLVYKGKKPMHVCPRCVTPLSNFEVGLGGYKDVTDISVTAQFLLKNSPEKQALFGQLPTYLLAWTTTPWTLPGNILLAVKEDMNYVFLKAKLENGQDVQFVVAEECLDTYNESLEGCRVDMSSRQVFLGRQLKGLSYDPLFTVFSEGEDTDLIKHNVTWTVQEADFVTAESGTGIVHIASGYGEDDMNLAKSLGIPVVQHVNMKGEFLPELGEVFSKLSVSGSDAKRHADTVLAEILKDKNLLFEQKSYRHSYPHCWRCDTPLLNYATDSWYVAVEKIKDKMLENNNKTNWVPNHLKHGRFGKWLENARDWAISRNRYWGTPLPIWEGENGTQECLGSLADIRKRITGRFTKITLMRHAESEGNIIHLRQSIPPGTPLTELGIQQAQKAGEKLLSIHQKEAFDRVYVSPLIRTQQTAQEVLKVMKQDLPVHEDELIQEINFGIYEGKKDSELREFQKKREALSLEEYYTLPYGETGESHKDLSQRALSFIKKLIEKHPGESILVVTHSGVMRLVLKEVFGKSLEQLYQEGHSPLATPKELYFDNVTGQLVDLHKHFVDEMTYTHPETGETMRRVEEVLDCWFESGSMPYAQAHYPFENKEVFEKTFPAQFIAEGLDQTRGWFYTLTVLAAALFDSPAFQNVIVNGIVLAKDGQKMSKSKKNYPDPNNVFNQHGADAMRLYLMHSPVVKADDFRFSEKGVEDVVRKTLLPLWNAYSFLLTYAETDNWKPKGQIYFVRHGQTALNQQFRLQGSVDEPLNYLGVEEAENLRTTTKHLPIDKVVSSSQIRARQTADILNIDFNLTVDVYDGLKEQDFGDFDGRLIHEVRQELDTSLHPYHAGRLAPPGGETLDQFEERVLKSFADIQKKYPEENVLLVAHGGVYHVLRKNALGVKSWSDYYTNHVRNINNAQIKLFSTHQYFKPEHKLDTWILSELHHLTKQITNGLDNYNLSVSLDPLLVFIDSLTNWYIRRSRRRFWKSDNGRDKQQAYQTLYIVLVDLCKLLAPFAPFITEEIYKNLTGLPSVHLEDWPGWNDHLIKQSLNQEVHVVQNVVSLGRAARARVKIKTRQPLSCLEVALPPEYLTQLDQDDMKAVIAEELNVKKVEFLSSVEGKVRKIIKPNAKLLGPRLGKEVQKVIQSAKQGNFTEKSNGSYLCEGYELSPEEIDVLYLPDEGQAGLWEVAADNGLVVLLNTELTPALEREGNARDIIRFIQDLRKQSEFDVSQRIEIGFQLDNDDLKKALEEYSDFIAQETLALRWSFGKLVTPYEGVLKLGDYGVVVTLKKIEQDQ